MRDGLAQGQARGRHTADPRDASALRDWGATRLFRALPEVEPDRLRLAISGEVDFTSHRAFERVLLAAEQVTRGRAITLDLSQVAFIDVTGCRAVMAAHGRLARRGLEFTLIPPHGPAARVFEVLGRLPA